MTTSRRYLALLGAFFVLPFTLSACGGGVPGNAVVKIGPDTIKTSEFDHYLRIAATAQQQQGGGSGKVVIPQPPDFAACIAEKKKTAPKPAKGQPTPTNATFKAQCQQDYNSLRDQVMQFLISSAWLQGEAADQGVKVSDQQVKQDFDKQRQQSFPTDSAYAQFLKSSGYTQEDLLYRTKMNDLSNDLRTKILKGTDNVSQQQITNYYNKNKKQFAQPERRDVRIVETKTLAKANQAKQALQSGQSWKTVAGKFSIDQGTRDSGGLMPGVAKGQQEKALDTAMFSAPKNKIQGPVKTQFGYYIFEVLKIYPPKQFALNDVKQQVKSTLVSQNQQNKLNDFVKNFQKKWKSRTDCRKGYIVQTCKNAPKVNTTSTAAGQTTPAQ